MAIRAEDYRRLAREALETARTVASEETRVGLIEMAGVWTRLADKLDAAVPPTTADEHESVAQPQQQQVQPTKDGDTRNVNPPTGPADKLPLATQDDVTRHGDLAQDDRHRT